MGGKSSYARQVALICLLAHMGSYVPANKASIPLLDSIHVRMGGASDDIIQHCSTFMKESQEIAQVLEDATPQSLVILDEVGRGTSATDGQAIAYAVLWYLLQVKKSWMVFVTHFGEMLLHDNLGLLERMRRGHMSFIEHEDDIIFLYQQVECNHQEEYSSFGMNVARMAHIPADIIQHAKNKATVLRQMHQKRHLKRALQSLYT
jgi:DNA mismatch repair ATPase MutS